jgi:ATP-dependent Lhr-like helicase
MTFQLEEERLRKALNEIQRQKLCFTYPQKPTPLAFPLMVDRLREKMSSEKLEDRIRKMMEL